MCRVAMLINLYFDESGVTGTNLTDEDHPYLVLASNCLSPEMAIELKNKFFARSTQGQLKHKNLKRRRPNDVIAFIREISTNHRDKFAFFVADKEFCLIIKLIQYWLEDRGDFKRDSMNVVAAHLLYIELKQVCSGREFSGLMTACKRMFAAPDIEAYKLFWQQIRTFARRKKDSIMELMVEANFNGGQEIYKRIFVQEPISVLSLHFTLLLGLFGHWQNGYQNARFNVYHDEGTEMAKPLYLEEWNTLLDPARPGIIRGHLSNLSCPLNIDHFDFNASSEAILQIQFSDILAGAAAEVVKGTQPQFGKTEYCQQLAEAGIFLLGVNAILPDLDLAISQHEEKAGKTLEKTWLDEAGHMIL
jgi:hypothetical protein